MDDSVRRESGGYIGQSVPRREDKNLLLGQGNFVADIQLPGMVHAAFARSPLPHAKIVSVDVTAARAMDGVCFAASGDDVMAALPADQRDAGRRLRRAGATGSIPTS